LDVPTIIFILATRAAQIMKTTLHIEENIYRLTVHLASVYRLLVLIIILSDPGP
jgi:uncharacterized membrane protein